ncbi:MAG: hypothetical protein J6X14_00860 [Lachnospiraceae bacterium]|nr:hypothetical protein [Lachnospiraceae bacterium]MBP5668843.1 hypothetical protein [Lachnospiraceae bacterium]
MNIISGYLLAANAGSGWTGDLFTAYEKNMENWAAEGDAEVSYADLLNVVTFENHGGDRATKFKAEILDTYGITLSDAQVTSILSTWQTNSQYKLVVWLETANLARPYVHFTWSNTYAITGQNITIQRPSYDRNGRKGTSGDIPSLSSGNWISSDIAVANTAPHEFGTYEAYGKNTIKFTLANFEVQTGTRYEFIFRYRTTTGFSYMAGAGDNVSVASGANEQTIMLDNAASEDFQEYHVSIVAGSNAMTFTMDFSEMSSASEIQLEFSNLTLMA